MIAQFCLLAATAGALLIAGGRLTRRLRPLLSARPSARVDHGGLRLGFALAEILSHRRLLRLRLSGGLHGLIFVSFLVLLTAILQAYTKVLFPDFQGFRAFAPLQDLCAGALLCGIALASYQRAILRPARFDGSNQRDAWTILGLIGAIILSMELEFAFHIPAAGLLPPYDHPLAGGIVALFPAGLPIEVAQLGEQAGYWLHIIAVLSFLVYLPGSKHLHMLVALPNILLRNRLPRGLLEIDDAGPPRVIGDLPWKGLLDLYACTECGRCQAACPAHAAGLPLSPKRLIMDLRDHLVATATGSPAAVLAGEVIAADSLWACTSCSACMVACPLHIEHLPKIVELRRFLVDEGEISPLLQNSLNSLQKYGNSFKKPPRQRPAWTKDLGFDIPDARDEAVDYLWFVGDYASYHPLVIRQTRQIATLLHRAGVRFGLLYDRERNSGNDVRRVGEEGLYQDLAQHNVAAIQEASFQRIVTTDPHSFNTLVNEYPAFGLTAEVIHYTQLLRELVANGTLPPPLIKRGRKATYHDPCYLGRYNGGFEAPRQLIRALGYDLREMRRNRENSFCCGAGGGRIFMDDPSPKERPSESRIREALEIDGLELFVVTCPKDLVMYRTAVDSVAPARKIEVVEISDLFFLP